MRSCQVPCRKSLSSLLHPFPSSISTKISLDKLLEGAVDWRAWLHALVEVNGGHGALADALWSEFEFLSVCQQLASKCLRL